MLPVEDKYTPPLTGRPSHDISLIYFTLRRALADIGLDAYLDIRYPNSHYRDNDRFFIYIFAINAKEQELAPWDDVEEPEEEVEEEVEDDE